LAEHPGLTKQYNVIIGSFGPAASTSAHADFQPHPASFLAERPWQPLEWLHAAASL